MKNFGSLLGGGKPRLYMALYKRAPEYPGDVEYHTALLLLPKGANPESVDKNAVCYHATLLDAQQGWKFEASKVRSKTRRLRALMLLGKVAASTSQLDEILNEVPVNNRNPEWRCCHWVWSALDDLVSAGVIDALPSPPKAIWYLAMKFADENPVDPDTGVIPTCTTTGEPARSALEGA